MAEKPTIFLGMPHYPGNLEIGAVLSILGASGDDFAVKFLNIGGSNTAKAFNMLWSAALNDYAEGKVQYFAMIHSDIVPKGNWIDILWKELHERKLDMISVVSPIKDDRGLTSTGCDIRRDDPWKVRRFTMSEIMRLPPTFGLEDTIAAGLNDEGMPLLVNTGCMLIDLNNPAWLEEDDEGNLKFRFTFYDRIEKNADGDWQAGSISEDWDWSRMMAARGLRYEATRKVTLSHFGRWPYKNNMAWGQWEYDQAHPELVKHEDSVCN